jgi:hypothetical protein
MSLNVNSAFAELNLDEFGRLARRETDLCRVFLPDTLTHLEQSNANGHEQDIR